MLSLSSSPKFQATAAPGPREKVIVELFRKVQSKLRERVAIKEVKKVEALQGQSNESETVGSLLKLLRKHSVKHGKRRDKDDSSGSGSDSSMDFIFDHPQRSGSFHEENSIVEEDSRERNASSARPVSKFRRKSPVPQANYTPTNLSDNATSISLSHLNLNEHKGPGLVDTHLEPGSELLPEPKLELELELELEHSFSDEVEFEVPDISANNAIDKEDRKEQCESRDLTAMKLTELRWLAKSCGMKGFSKMKKSDLLKLLSLCSL